MAAAPPASRLQGLDLARGLAIFGMIVVHFVQVMPGYATTPAWSKRILDALDGRPAMIFMLLAGMGVTLMARKAAQPEGDLRIVDGRLRRRGIFLFTFGFFNLLVWSGDILRVYGVTLMLAPWLVRRSSRSLLFIAGAFFAGFVLLLCVADYERNWDWSTMTYHNLWTTQGVVRNLFYDGFRSVFPWTGFMVFGMWLGRWEWTAPAVARRAMKWGAVAMVVSWAVSTVILRGIAAMRQPELANEDVVALFGLLSMPPLLLFAMNAGGCALLVIGASTWMAQRFPGAWLVRAVSATGRLAFTWYVGHIFIGIGGVYVLGWIGVPHGVAYAGGLACCVVVALLSLAILRRFRGGPLEWMLRRVAG